MCRFFVRTGLDCSFDSGLCNWRQASYDDFNWRMRKGSTPTSGTGPNGDHTSGKGTFHSAGSLRNSNFRFIWLVVHGYRLCSHIPLAAQAFLCLKSKLFTTTTEVTAQRRERVSSKVLLIPDRTGVVQTITRE